MSIRTPSDVLLDQLRDLYSVECQVILTLPALATAATNPHLREVLLNMEKAAHLHKERLRTACAMLDQTPDGEICRAMQGLIEGGNQHFRQPHECLTGDLLLIAHGNRMIHYEIAGYCFASALAKQLGREDVHALISKTLEEEKGHATSLADAAAVIFGEVTTEKHAA